MIDRILIFNFQSLMRSLIRALDETRICRWEAAFFRRFFIFLYRLFLSVAIVSSPLLRLHRHLIPHVFFAACVRFYFTPTLFTRMQSIRDINMAIFRCYYETLKRRRTSYIQKKVNKVTCFSLCLENRLYYSVIISVCYKSICRGKR